MSFLAILVSINLVSKSLSLILIYFSSLPTIWNHNNSTTSHYQDSTCRYGIQCFNTWRTKWARRKWSTQCSWFPSPNWSIPKTSKCHALTFRQNTSYHNNGNGYNNDIHYFTKPRKPGRSERRTVGPLSRIFKKSLHLHIMQQCVSKPMSSCMLPYLLCSLSKG